MIFSGRSFGRRGRRPRFWDRSQDSSVLSGLGQRGLSIKLCLPLFSGETTNISQQMNDTFLIYRRRARPVTPENAGLFWTTCSMVAESSRRARRWLSLTREAIQSVQLVAAKGIEGANSFGRSSRGGDFHWTLAHTAAITALSLRRLH
jgi:hypothetical protein